MLSACTRPQIIVANSDNTVTTPRLLTQLCLKDLLCHYKLTSLHLPLSPAIAYISLSRNKVGDTSYIFAMSDTSESISLQVTVHLKPEDLPKFWEAFEPTYKAVTAEPECTFFELYQAPDSPGTISWVENWYVSFSSWFLVVDLSASIC